MPCTTPEESRSTLRSKRHAVNADAGNPRNGVAWSKDGERGTCQHLPQLHLDATRRGTSMSKRLSESMRCLLMASFALACSAAAAGDGPRLLLAGGATPVCSSADPEFCVGARAPGPAPLASRYRLDADGIARVAARGWLAHRESQRDRVLAALRRWHQRVGDIDFAAADVDVAMTAGRSADQRAWSALASFEQARVFDALERTPVREQVALADSTPASGAAIFREFIAMARTAGGRQRPRVLVSTASSRDPFAAIDYYLQLFAQAGAEVRWLPLDHTLRAAWRKSDRQCDQLDRLRGALLAAHDRDRLHPQRAAELAAVCVDPGRLVADVAWADALFFNGGDQSFTRAAWFEADGFTPSAELKLMLARLDAGELILGGTSAGTAVQSARPGTTVAAMLVSGPALPSTPALAQRELPPDPGCAAASACGGIDPDALLYHPDGGLGSFPFGVLDTHFSNRGREYRLARLLLDTGVELGLGVDETTALRLDRRGDAWHGQVIGQGSVTLLQRVDDTRVQRQRHPPGSRLRLPLPAAQPVECAETEANARNVAADSDALSAFIDRVPPQRAQALILVQGQHRQPAGRVCASADGSVQQWAFE